MVLLQEVIGNIDTSTYVQIHYQYKKDVIASADGSRSANFSQNQECLLV